MSQDSRICSHFFDVHTLSNLNHTERLLHRKNLCIRLNKWVLFSLCGVDHLLLTFHNGNVEKLNRVLLSFPNFGVSVLISLYLLVIIKILFSFI